jgi:hypothetical protein
MRQVKAHYDTYPDTPENFEEWRLQTEALVSQARAKLVE